MPSPAFAVTKLWNNVGAGNWDTAGNWTPANEPIATDDATINNGGAAQVTTTGNVARIFKLGDTAAGTLSVNSGGGLLSTTTTLGTSAGANGTATVDGTGSLWEVNGIFIIGSAGTGTVNVTNGATLNETTTNSNGTTLGSAATGNGTLNVGGTGSTAAFTGAPLKIGALGTGNLNITNGGLVSVVTTTTFGVSAGSTGNLLVDNGTLNVNLNGNPNYNVILLGSGGNSAAVVQNGGVINTNSISIASAATSTSSLHVTGAGSTVNATVGLNVGLSGTGSLAIDSGGVVNSGATIIGRGTASSPTATATVDGAGSQWNTGSFLIGQTSNGTLGVTNGAALTSASVAVGATSGAGTVTLDNSTWDVSGGTAVGAAQNGTLNIINGADLTIGGSLALGASTNNNVAGNSTGTILVDGVGSTLTVTSTAATVEVSQLANRAGVLTIQNGGTAHFSPRASMDIGARTAGSNGTVTVTGAGSSLTVDSLLKVGQIGAGTLSVLDGAVLNSGSVYAANGAGTTATMLVDDATWNITDTPDIEGFGPARLGAFGSSVLTVQNGGILNTTGGGIDLAVQAGGSSILNIENGGGAAGIINTPTITGGPGTAIINFNHTDAAYNFAPSMQGNLTVNQMNTGTTILTGDSNHTGDTNITDGILRAGVTDAFSENSAYHMNGGLLDLDNLDNEIGSLDGTTNVTLGTGTLTTGSIGSTVYSGVISGTGGLIKTGSTAFLLDTAQTYTGATTVEQGLLAAGVTNVITASSGLTVSSPGIFNMGGFDQTVDDLDNNGTVIFGLPIDHNLTITNNLTGGGLFGMGSRIDSDITDNIIVGGTSSGNHTITLLNAGDAPNDLTKTFQVVSTTDSSTGGAQFALAGDSVDIGIYSYQLVRGDGSSRMPDPNAWYLALNLQNTSEAARAILNTAAGLSNTWFTQLDNLHRRMGHQRLSAVSGTGQHEYDVWARGYGRKVEVDDSVSGLPFHERINGFDVGADKVLESNVNGGWLGGVFAGYGEAERTFNNLGSEGASDTPYAGLYATWFNSKNKIYMDFTAKVQYFSNDFTAIDASGNDHEGSYDNWATGASVEVGKRIDIGNEGWSLQPQAQVAHVHVFGQEYTTRRNSQITVEDSDIIQLRAGLEGGKTYQDEAGAVWYPYARVSVVDQESFGGHIKTDTLDWDPGLEGTSLEYGVGLIYQADNNRQGYVTIMRSNGEHMDSPWGFNVGFRYEF